MIITETVFACFREWHRDVVASAFFADDENVMIFFAAMNVVPADIRASESGDSAAALEVCTPCCHECTLILEQDRLQILQLLRDGPLSIEGKKCGLATSAGSVDAFPTYMHGECAGKVKFVDRLLHDLHLSSCWWRQGDFVRQMLRTPRFSLGETAVMRHRCAAVVMADVSNININNNNINRATEASVGVSSVAKVLLPRGSPPSFIREVLTAPIANWLRAKMEERPLSRLTSNTQMSLLRAFFAIKRPRSEENNNNNNNNSNDGDEGDELVPSLCLLVALFGYTLSATPPSHPPDASGVDIAWHRLSADMTCHFCGGRPALTVEKLVADESQVVAEQQHQREVVVEEKEGEEGKEEEKEKEEVMEMYSETQTEDSKASDHNLNVVENVSARSGSDKVEHSSQHCRFHYTVHLSEQTKFCGHHTTCPWRTLFLQFLLGDTLASSSSSREIYFDISNMDEEGSSLRLCFELPEVVKLVECWRRSLYVESICRETYIKHPLPAAVRAVIPMPADAETEKYLSELASRTTEEEAAKLKPLIPLSEDRSPWESCLCVASFLKACIHVDKKEPEPQMNNNNNNNNSDAGARSKPLEEEKRGHWKAAYDAGRRCVLASLEETRAETTTVELSEKFKELYHRSALQHDPSSGIINNHTFPPLPPPSFEGVVSNLSHLLSDMFTVNSLHGGKGFMDEFFKAPHITAQEQRQVHSFVDSILSIIENATPLPPAPPAPAQQQQQRYLGKGKNAAPAPAPAQSTNANVSNMRKVGANVTQKKQQKQPQVYQQQHHHQHQHSHQHQHYQHQHQQQLRQQVLKQPVAPHALQHHPSPYEGVLFFPGVGVLSSPGSFIHQHHHHVGPQQQQQQQLFPPAVHEFPFASVNRGTVFGTDAVTFVDNTLGPRPSVMGQSGRGGNHRGNRGGGRGGRGGGGGNPFKN